MHLSFQLQLTFRSRSSAMDDDLYRSFDQHGNMDETKTRFSAFCENRDYVVNLKEELLSDH